jgi:site-specific recombinase XerD
MTLYGTGMRRCELAHLKVGDIDSQRMIIRVVAGKGAKDRDLPLISFGRLLCMHGRAALCHRWQRLPLQHQPQNAVMELIVHVI